MARSDKHKHAADAYRREHEKGLANDAETDQPSGRQTRKHTDESVADSVNTGAGFEKTGLEKATRPAAEALPALDEPSGVLRAAKLLIAIGSDEAAAVLAQLGPAEVEKVTRAIIETGRVHRGELEREMEEARAHPRGRILTGGPEFARELLVKTFGQDEGERVFLKAVPDDVEPHFAFLNELEPKQLHTVLKGESAAAIAVVMAHLEPTLAAGLMASLDDATKKGVAGRIATMGRLDRDAVLAIEAAMKEKIRHVGTEVSEAVDGTAMLAAILRNMDPTAGDEILRDLEVTDDELAGTIRDQIFTTDVLQALSTKDLATVLREFDDRSLALFLKGKSEELRRHLLAAVSDRRNMMISEEYHHLGAQRRSDVEEVTREILDRVRQLDEDGVILVPRGDERYI